MVDEIKFRMITFAIKHNFNMELSILVVTPKKSSRLESLVSQIISSNLHNELSIS